MSLGAESTAFSWRPQRNIIPNAAKVVNGVLADEGEYPYAVSLQNEFGHFCGGSLITPSVVLTASHCFEDEIGPSGFVEANVFAFLGCNDVIDGDCEIIEAEDFIFHPNYDFAQSVLGGSDLLWILLAEPSNQSLVQLPSPLVGQDTFTNFPSFEIGWGNEDPAAYVFVGGDDLMEADSLILDNNVCEEQNDIFFDLVFGLTDTIDDTMICSIGDGKSVCQGDSGGPLVIKCDGSDEDLLIGATSFGLGCGVPGIPNVFARTFDQAAFDFTRIVATLADEFDDLQFVEDFDDFCPDAPVVLDPNVVPTAFPTIDASLWECAPDAYATQDGCDCNCGLPDPDCIFDDNIVRGCGVNGECDAEGFCVGDGDGNNVGLVVGISVAIVLLLCGALVILLVCFGACGLGERRDSELQEDKMIVN